MWKHCPNTRKRCSFHGRPPQPMTSTPPFPASKGQKRRRKWSTPPCNLGLPPKMFWRCPTKQFGSTWVFFFAQWPRRFHCGFRDRPGNQLALENKIWLQAKLLGGMLGGGAPVNAITPPPIETLIEKNGPGKKNPLNGHWAARKILRRSKMGNHWTVSANLKSHNHLGSKPRIALRLGWAWKKNNFFKNWFQLKNRMN